MSTEYRVGGSGGAGNIASRRRIIRYGRVIKGDQVIVAPPHDRSEPEKDESEEPTVIVHRKDGVVESLEVACPCGRTIRVYLDYQEGQETQESGDRSQE